MFFPFNVLKMFVLFAGIVEGLYLHCQLSNSSCLCFFMVRAEIVLFVVNNGGRIQSAAPCETISFIPTRSSEC